MRGLRGRGELPVRVVHVRPERLAQIERRLERDVLIALLERALDLPDVGEELGVLARVRLALGVRGRLHQQLLPSEVHRAVCEELLREPARHPGASLLDGVGERGHERDLQVVLVIHRLMGQIEPVVPGVSFDHGSLRLVRSRRAPRSLRGAGASSKARTGPVARGPVDQRSFSPSTIAIAMPAAPTARTPRPIASARPPLASRNGLSIRRFQAIWPPFTTMTTIMPRSSTANHAVENFWLPTPTPFRPPSYFFSSDQSRSSSWYDFGNSAWYLR